jgi:conjugal transfer pilus assembly protein TraV
MRQLSNKLCLTILVSLLFALFSGCSAIVSPYNSQFQCPETDNGKCVSVQTAYKESIDNPLVKSNPDSTTRPGDKKDKPPCETCGNQQKDQPETIRKPDVSPSRDSKYQYQGALYRKLASLIEQPSTPIVVPPDVVRVLILSYTGSENELFSYRYVYFFATEPEWIISTTKEAE